MDRPRWLPALVVATAALLAPGCVQARLVEGSPIPFERIADLRAGVTTKQQVLEWFGAPQSFTDLDVLHRLIRETGYVTDEVVEAPYSDVLVFQLSEAEVEGLILLVYSRFDVRVTTERLIVFFDADDVVTSWGYGKAVDDAE